MVILQGEDLEEERRVELTALSRIAEGPRVSSVDKKEFLRLGSPSGLEGNPGQWRIGSRPADAASSGGGCFGVGRLVLEGRYR